MAHDVLVVDDNPVIVKIVSEILKKMGYQVRAAADGLTALNILEEYRPDIIFIDLVLPEISGEMLCKVLRSKKRFDDTYIVILSAIAAESGPDLSTLGADTCIAKGKNMARHLQTVLADIAKGEVRNKRFTIHGMEDVYAREVTVELLDSKKHLEVILANLSDGLLEITAKGEILYANPAAEKILAVPQDQILGATLFQFFTGDDRTYVQELFAAAQKKKNVPSDDQPLAIQSRFINLRIVPLKKAGKPACIVIIRDMTERKIAEEALQKSEEHYRELIENTSDMVQNIGPDGTILYVNTAWKKILGYSDAEIAGLTIGDIIAPEYQQKCMNLLADVCRGAKGENIETAFLTKDGNRVEVLGNASCRMENGQAVYTRGIFHDITKRKELEERLKKLSATDQLTGAYNRRGFDDFFSREVSRANRYQEELSLALFDIDHFKKVNDEHGHDIGDRVLQELVRLTKEQVREIDSLFRWGGEEFLLLMPKTSLEAAEGVVERLRSKVAGWDFLLPEPVTISIGISAYQTGDSAEKLIKRADLALYQAKAGGRNRVEVSP